MRIAVIFDSPYPRWTPEEHDAQCRREIEALQQTGAEPEVEYQVAHALRSKGHEVALLGVNDNVTETLAWLRANPVELVWNAVESFQGNDQLDYLLPALLEAEDIPFTGAPPLGLMVTRNKAMTKKILAHHGVPVPKFKTWMPGEKVSTTAKIDLAFPVIVKPLSKDASVGIAQASVVRDVEALAQRVAFVHERFREPAIVEEFVDGRELYVTLVGNGRSVEMLPIVELVFDKEKTRPEERIATGAAKWDEPYRQRKGIKTIFARPISQVALKRIERACRTAYRALWLRDYARFDLRLDADDQVWMIEGNANAYIAQGHEVASAAEKAGMKYDELVERIARVARARYRAPGRASAAR